MVGTQGETRWVAKTGGNEVPQVVERRYQEVNGGRAPFQVVISRVGGVWEVGPFGNGGASIQFGSLDPAEPFNGTFSATITRSLRPGRMHYQGNGTDDVDSVGGIMNPRGLAADYVDSATAAAVGAITHIAGPASRIRISADAFTPGTGGPLACWVV